MPDPRTGAERIAAKRQRQVEQEGWTPSHDDEHHDGELALAAACYASPVELFLQIQAHDGSRERYADPWPWDSDWSKRPGKDATIDQRIRALEKAGARWWWRTVSWCALLRLGIQRIWLRSR